MENIQKSLKFTSWVGMCWRVEALAWPHHEGIHKMEQIHDFFNQQLFVGAVAYGGSDLCWECAWHWQRIGYRRKLRVKWVN